MWCEKIIFEKKKYSLKHIWLFLKKCLNSVTKLRATHTWFFGLSMGEQKCKGAALCHRGQHYAKGGGIMPRGPHHVQEEQHGQGEQHARNSNMLRGSSMPGIAACRRGATWPGGAAWPGATCSGEHAQGEQHARGSSMRMGSSIPGLYIASLHEIEGNFVSGFEFENQLYIKLEKVNNSSSCWYGGFRDSLYQW